MDPGEPFTPVIIPLLDGFVVGLGLIIALGPQGLFVLCQGLARQHLHLVCLLCSLSDVALITASIAGSLLLSALPGLSQAIALGGAAFLLWYGFDRIRAGAMPAAPTVAEARGQSWGLAAISCLAVTWLNPAVYSDMLVIGGLASAMPMPTASPSGSAPASRRSGSSARPATAPDALPRCSAARWRGARSSSPAVC